MSEFGDGFNPDDGRAFVTPAPGSNQPELRAEMFGNGDSEILESTAGTVRAAEPSAEDRKKTKAELLEELTRLRSTVAELESTRKTVDDMQSALGESQEKYRVLVENANDAIVVAQDGAICYANPKAAQVSGYSEDELLSSQFVDFVHPDDREFVYMRHMIGLQNCRGEPGMIYPFRIVTKDGREVWVEINPVSISWEGRPATLNLLLDITERKQAERTIVQLAYHDSLTGLPNRVLFRDRLAAALTHAGRNHTDLALMMLDLDQFKKVNDFHGHDVGDALLRSVGTRLSDVLRKSDTVARMGGDEFLVLLPEIARSSDAATIISKLLDTFARPFELDGETVSVTASIGVATYPEHGADAAALMKRADDAMYLAKESGGNTSVTASLTSA